MKKDAFFEAVGRHVGLTFDDVSLRTAHSEVLPHKVDTASRFSRNVSLKIPLVSAAMDTVTEHRLAIALAELGGLGVIHRAMDKTAQAKEVDKVKNHIHGLVHEPLCVSPVMTMAEVENVRRKHGISFHSFPVLNENSKVVGVLTRNDFEFCDTLERRVGSVMSEGVLTGTTSPMTSAEEAYEIMRREKKKVLPLVDSNGNLDGMYTFKDVRRAREGGRSTHNTDSEGHLLVGAAIGVGESEERRLSDLVKAGVDVVVIDTAHGDSHNVFEMVAFAKRKYPWVDVVAGNVSEPESVARLASAKADGIKVGQGPGAGCITRTVAGIGAPQFSAIYYCARDTRVPICADGGIQTPADVSKAIAAGASSVMMGSIFAKTTEAPGDVVSLKGRQWKKYRGMGSRSAMRDSQAGRERYAEIAESEESFVPEGGEGLVEYIGDTRVIVRDFAGGLKKAMGYVGGRTIAEFQKRADFVQVTNAGKKEAGLHDILATEDERYRG